MASYSPKKSARRSNTVISADEPQLPLPPSSSGSLAGTKRSAAALLPPFEPLSSSPGLPRPMKRQNTGHDAHLRYPTPIPTSSTGILSSSPLRRTSTTIGAPRLSALEARTPLGALPSVELAETGETLVMGRSSNSAHFQLSTNRLISRTHVLARYIPASSSLVPNKIEIVCDGWNGVKIHCQGRSWELWKGDSFTSETQGTEVMLQVHDSRVRILWPHRVTATAAVENPSPSYPSETSWDDSPPRAHIVAGDLIGSSPLRHAAHIQSPVSPTPLGNAVVGSPRLHDLFSSREEGDGAIEIYEDEPELPGHETEGRIDPNLSTMTQVTAMLHSSQNDDGEENEPDEEGDPNEENDPIVHSFGPFGADISNRLASIMTKSPRVCKPLQRDLPELTENAKTLATDSESSLSSEPPSPKEEKTATAEEQTNHEVAPCSKSEAKATLKSEPAMIGVTNHVVNQLAYSRLSSTPLSTIMQHLPADLKVNLSRETLREVIESTACIGIITRQGKDAAGKALESEYYYVAEADNDEQRRAAVVDGLRKPSLRACRKQHKVRSF